MGRGNQRNGKTENQTTKAMTQKELKKKLDKEWIKGFLIGWSTTLFFYTLGIILIMKQEEIEDKAARCLDLSKNLKNTYHNITDYEAYKLSIMAAIKDAYMLGFSDAQHQTQFIDKQEVEKP